MTESSAPLSIDIVSDVVCPWCYVGKRHLERALEDFGAPVEIRWRPYQLDPTIPPEGYDRHAYMMKKFGDTGRLADIHDRLEMLGRTNGIDFAFPGIKRSPNTMDAHRLIRWSAEIGAQDSVVTALFRAYFEQGRDIGDASELAAISGEVGLDPDVITARLSTDEDIDDIRGEIAEAQRIGVQGVPFFILNRRLGVSGAQPPEMLTDAIRQAMRPA